jgi:preprotein translocase subunit SecE
MSIDVWTKKKFLFVLLASLFCAYMDYMEDSSQPYAKYVVANFAIIGIIFLVINYLFGW